MPIVIQRAFIASCLVWAWGFVWGGSTPVQRDIEFTSGLGLRGGARAGRVAFRPDEVERLMVTGEWKAPREGETLASDGTHRVAWERVVADTNGVFFGTAFRGGYFFVSLTADEERIMLLEASGHNLVYVNGEPRAGDVYQNGYVALPVQLRRGTNEFLFATGRGSLRAKLVRPPSSVFFDLRDPTLPDLVRGERMETRGAVLVVNATTQDARGLTLRSQSPGGRASTTRLPTIPPLTTRKVGFEIRHSGVAATNRVDFMLELNGGHRRSHDHRDRKSVSLRLREPGQTRRVTFVSEIDGSVQYYALNPALPDLHARRPLALVLSTHGASVEAQGQADAYTPKTWAHLVAPTNRRPYGFDWEDWGRMDAMEVLSLAQETLGTDRSLTFLTGHSMGGHGAWQLAAHFPDRFAAVAPSAGWVSFFSYAGGRRDDSTNAVRSLLRRASTPSDTLAMSSNYLHHGVYVLHGDADDNVPVREARTMRSVLEKFHRDFKYHEQPGAGHWWGNACVDWPPLFDLFARRRIPSAGSVTSVQFTTTNPGISARAHWLGIEAQERFLAPSTVRAEWDGGSRRIVASTDNASRLSFAWDWAPKGEAPSFVIDGQTLAKLSPRRLGFVHFRKEGGSWRESDPVSLDWKGPHRNGPFKEAFRHRMMFVYGTKGTPEENAWAYAKARFDAESFWYRGNGSVDVLPDLEFDPRRDSDRSVILYGHADANAAWEPLLGVSPVQVRRGHLVVGGETRRGDDLAALFLRPRPGSHRACVAVVAGTGLVGLRLTDRIPYFLAGVALPDWTVWTPRTLREGPDGVLGAGFFGQDWGVESGESAWNVPE
ncbi:MAG: alpha/beta hydrolase [Verrucomicrobia bacterium]|nr:alpha/beta hydrolase [Verrucomicrobiota bacterium]